MEIWYIFVAVPIIGAILHFFIIKKELTKNRVLEVLLLWFLGGLAQIVSPEIVAQSVGWPNSPFLREVGFANISYGILGILSIKYRSFWAPTIIAYAVFMWGAAISHIHNIQQTGNLASGNAGTVLYLDILMPIIFILLLFTYNKTKVVIGN